MSTALFKNKVSARSKNVFLVAVGELNRREKKGDGTNERRQAE